MMTAGTAESPPSSPNAGAADTAQGGGSADLVADAPNAVSNMMDVAANGPAYSGDVVDGGEGNSGPATRPSAGSCEGLLCSTCKPPSTSL